MNKAQIDAIKAKNEGIDEQNALIWKMQSETKKMMVESIHDMLTEMGGKVDVDFDMDDDYPLVTYDGGRHAEYNSTICGVVESVKAVEKNGVKDFTIDIQYEETDYESDRLDHGDIATIFDFVCGQFSEYMADLKIKPKKPKKTQNYRFTYRVETFIEAESPSDAQSKFEEIEFPSNMDFVEMVSFEDEDGCEIDEDLKK